LHEILEERPEEEPLIELLNKPAENTPLPNSPSASESVKSPKLRSADDALEYSVLDPDYDEHGFDVDRLVKTHYQEQEGQIQAYLEEIHGQQEDDHPMEEDPALPQEQNPPDAGNTFTTTSLQVSLEEAPGSIQPQALTPTSAVESIPSSEAVSASSSAPDIASLRPQKSSVAARCSRNYQGLCNPPPRLPLHDLVPFLRDDHPCRAITLCRATTRHDSTRRLVAILTTVLRPRATVISVNGLPLHLSPHPGLIEEEVYPTLPAFELSKRESSTGSFRTLESRL
jgi:hypothetical protein